MKKSYKLMLVDDEAQVRQAVIRRMDWAALGYDVVGEASNGEEALEMAEALEPDVIMTDIRMPFMDGLELCRRVKRQLPGTRIAILTGFDEFEYAREAIGQQVEDYILKPVDAEALAAIFTRIRASLDEEIASRRDMEKLRQHYNESLQGMRQQALLALLSGSSSSSAALSELREYGLPMEAAAYCAAVVQYECEGEDQQLLSITLRGLVSDVMPKGLRHYVLHLPKRIAVLFLLRDGEGVHTINEALRALFPLSRKFTGMRIGIGIGKTYPDPQALSRSYEEASSALEYRFLLEKDQCVYIGDIEPGTGGEYVPDSAYGDTLLRQIKIGSQAELALAVTDLIDHLRTRGISPSQYQIYFMELFTGLLKLVRTYRIDEREARLEQLFSEGMTMRFHDLDELGGWLLSFSDNLRRLARKERRDSICLLVDKAKDILESRYMDAGLSLEAICAQLNVSHAYFSTMFKKETGEGFVGYLTGLRMDKAIELLGATDDKTYLIAEKVGYSDPNYFSYVFKKRFGVSPSKYRAGLGGAGG